MSDVIGTPPEPPRHGRRLRLPAVPGGHRMHRVVGAVVAVAVAAGIVAVSRAGLESAPTVPAAPTGPVPVQGVLLHLAAGQDTVYALIQDCRRPDPCRIVLVASGNDGRTWRELALPGGRPTEAVARRWRLEVAGPEDQLSIEDEVTGTLRVGTDPSVTRRIVPAEPLARVPAGREALTRVCARPRCPTPAVEYLEARTGERRRLATQPPFPPTAFTAEGPQLWAAGIDPRTRRYAVAVSTDDGGTWRSVPMPTVPPEGQYVVRLVPVPEQQSAYLLVERPDDRQNDVFGIWVVPDPVTTLPPRQLRPEDRMLQLDSAVGLRDGRLALAGGAPAVVAPDGVVDLLEVAEPGAPMPPFPRSQLQRGPRGQLVADGTGKDGVGIVISATGDPNDWQQRLIRLPAR